MYKFTESVTRFGQFNTINRKVSLLKASIRENVRYINTYDMFSKCYIFELCKPLLTSAFNISMNKLNPNNWQKGRGDWVVNYILLKNFGDFY